MTREPRDVLGEALRLCRNKTRCRLTPWPILGGHAIRRMWLEAADFIIARLAEAGYRIVEKGD